MNLRFLVHVLTSPKGAHVTPMAGITLLVIGAILEFAVTGSISGIDLHVVGTVFIITGVALLLLLPILRGGPRPRRWPARSRQDAIDEADAGQGRQRVPDDHEG
ncbi:DUF6458 family protein [Actinomadura opuntiae]|uniref:DUF6458 family protein n=1 Tax=Actinomadura sp. OS1-43 TaxID=604315 RepID=UPI00255B1B46|nr:DUF6458 family protein [Actinomadura sp. OS1-43]MDL4815260.1 DUF6458 family protein [Actinomadura sp. OS1-43]